MFERPNLKQLVVAWIKKVLCIHSPSAWFNSGGEYDYEYDWIKARRKK